MKCHRDLKNNFLLMFLLITMTCLFTQLCETMFKCLTLACFYAFQSSTQLGSPSTSPAQSPTPSHLTNVKNVRPGLTSLPIMPQFPRSIVPGQGEFGCSVKDKPRRARLRHAKNSNRLQEVYVGFTNIGQQSLMLADCTLCFL